ncbi:uncharacterized protein [Argopecten irradians]|uniref:uncharacterized protein n=1 Tax=Argopecten irradians TaxID=31199 RepID=UPI0037223460
MIYYMFQSTINYNDLREYKDEFNIETMKVRHAENLSIGKQTVLPPGGPPVGDRSAANSSRSQNIHSDLLPQIETTVNRIKTEKGKQFIQTKAYHDAQEKLRMNRVLVIKGNTGDGKTSTTFQLVHWLMEEEQCRKPLQLHEIKDLKLLAPHSDLVCIIDDIFGERDIGRSEVQEWNKSLKNVETLFANKQNQTNILIITIRNEIFNVLEEKSLGTVFMKDNIIDLSSNEYKIKEEKQKLLAMYTPTNLTWTEEEEEKIVAYAPHIGFPQCCQLFYNSAELQKKRAEFFEKPVTFFIEALSNLPECPAILFLFLNGGEILVNGLDPNANKVNKTLLELAFSIELVDNEERRSREYEEKVDFVKESLDKLLGFLVKKGKHWSGREVYRFDHDSIYVTAALLYGKKTPVGYIKHCPSKALSYLTTLETSTDMVVISSGHYNDLCERLLREIESVKRYDYAVIGSLDVWKDRLFVEIFDKLLDEKKVNKLNILNKACKSGLVELASYLLEKGVKPDKDTDWWGLISRGDEDGEVDENVLNEVVVYLNDEIKYDLLNKACKSGSSKCGISLLKVGAKPDEKTMLDVAEGGSMDLYNILPQFGVTPTGRDWAGFHALHVACWSERLEIVTALCDDYPHLVQVNNTFGLSPLHRAAGTGNCSIFQTVEKTIHKVKDEQHKCETVDERLIRRSQYMCQLVDSKRGTVLHWTCMFGGKDLCVYICRTYPAMTVCIDDKGYYCLHYLAIYQTDVDWFIECEMYVRKQMESLQQNYDIKNLLDGMGKSVLDHAKERMERQGERKNALYDHLLDVFF